MERSSAVNTATGEQLNPIDQDGLCMLSLDGGGVRGLSTLYILKRIMTRLNHERSIDGLPAVKPCEVFDLIGGTSTGGLIAIMLGRLEMDVDKCISAYENLMTAVFEKQLHKTPIGWRGRVQPRFSTAALKVAIEEIITNQNFSPTDPFDGGSDHGCRVFVCTASKDLYGITRLRSYNLPEKSCVPATICEAALATLVATGYFDPVTVAHRHFVDGPLGANNPAVEVEEEASDIWCSDTGDIKSLVKCFISIGTGNPGKKAIEDKVLNFLTKSLVRITTDTEETAQKVLARWRQHYEQNRYFRLNVKHGLQNVGLAEYKEKGKIIQSTDMYLDDHTQVIHVRDCVRNLKLKQRKAKRSLAESIEEYKLNAPRNQPLPPCHCIPPKNKQFVGRENVIDALSRRLFTPGASQKVAIDGLGSIGKTQVALQLAYWTKENKPEYSVFWVPAINNASIEQAYTEISKKLAIRKSTEDENLRDLVRRTLSSPTSGKWLLIVDNADDMDVMFGSPGNSEDGLYDYLPESDDGLILLTTRFSEVADSLGCEITRLEEMGQQEAMKLLEGLLLNRKDLFDDRKRMTELLQELTYLPLAIKQAAAHLSRNRTLSIAKYLELLRGTEPNVVSLLSREFHDITQYKGSRTAIATTWLVSFDQIRKLDCGAANLLSFISCIEPKAIPRSILPQLHSEEETIHAIGTLEAYSFMSQREDGDTFDMHSLVHLATRAWVKRNNQAMQTKTNATRHLATVFPSIHHQNREQWRACLPHALRIIQPDEGPEIAEKYGLCFKVGVCLLTDGLTKEGVKHLEECYQWQTSHLDQNHPARLGSQQVLGHAYLVNGQTKEGMSLLKEMVQIREQIPDGKHLGQLDSQVMLTKGYLESGQTKDAVSLLEKVVYPCVKEGGNGATGVVEDRRVKDIMSVSDSGWPGPGHKTAISSWPLGC